MSERKLEVFGPVVTVPDMPDQPADDYVFEPVKRGCPCREVRP